MKTTKQLTDMLAERVMGWRLAPGRYIKSGRGWVPRWRFRPTEKLEDAFRLFEPAAPQKYSLSGDDKGNIHVLVRIAGAQGKARGTSTPLAITYAIARALGIEVES